jgi:hypothetical protein
MNLKLSGLTAVTAGLVLVANVEAQQMSMSHSYSRWIVTTAPAGTVAPGVDVPSVRGGVWPYSYYVLTPYPARGYIEYGSGDQFPFYGRAYGNPGDRWSWYYMGGGDSRYLAKYYYPILP